MRSAVEKIGAFAAAAQPEHLTGDKRNFSSAIIWTASLKQPHTHV